MGSKIRFTLARMCRLPQNLANSRSISLLLLYSFFWIVAAASFSGFVGKWGLRDGSQRYGVEIMLDATAQKPFVYRQLAPMVANFLDRYVPENLKNVLTARIKPEKTFAKTTSVVNPKYHFRYICIYYFSFFALFLSLFILRRILLDFGIGSVTAIVTPTAFVLAFPYLQTVGGYFYDNLELFFASLAFLVAARGMPVALIALAVPATLNKETFFFILPTLYPLLRQNLSPKIAMIATSISILASAIINLMLKSAFFDAPGGFAEFHFYENIKALVIPLTYHQIEITYGIVGPAEAFLGSLAVIAVVVLRGWSYCPQKVHQHLIIAIAINLPLFMVFCAVGELRNLSLLFVGFVILMGFSIDRRIDENGYAKRLTNGNVAKRG